MTGGGSAKVVGALSLDPRSIGVVTSKDPETPPPAHVSVFRAVKFEDSGSWNYHPRFQEAEQLATRELSAAFKKEKSLRQALSDIDTAANAIMDRQV